MSLLSFVNFYLRPAPSAISDPIEVVYLLVLRSDLYFSSSKKDSVVS